jgi:hypothetical protein
VVENRDDALLHDCGQDGHAILGWHLASPRCVADVLQCEVIRFRGLARAGRYG